MMQKSFLKFAYKNDINVNLYLLQIYKYRVLPTIQMQLILLWVLAEWVVLGRAKTALKFNYEIKIG